MRAEPLRRAALLLGIAALGGCAGVATLAFTSGASGPVGPGIVELRASAARSGGTRLSLPPLGSVSAATHRAPVTLEAQVNEIDLDELQTVLAAPDPQARLEALVQRDLEPLLRSMVLRAVVLALVVGGLVAALLPGRRLLHLPVGSMGGGLAVAVLLVATWRTYDTAAFSQPHFQGTLERAPGVLRAVGRHVDDLAHVRRRVSTLSRELSSLYTTLALPAGPAAGEIRLLHVSDIHLNPLGLEITRQLAERFTVAAIVDTGDLTSYGYPVEARFAELLVGMPAPYVVVPGNHDSDAVRAALGEVANVQVLDGVTEIGGVRILGVADPTFTADNAVGPEEAAEQKRRAAFDVARRTESEQPDLLAVHDPLLAGRSMGRVPLVIAGHVHRRGNRVNGGTRVLTVGSTGATGLGTFTIEGGRAYEAQVLTFVGGRLTAVDYVSLKGIGGSFRIDRFVVDPPAPDAERAGPGQPGPTTSPSSTSTPPPATAGGRGGPTGAG